MLSDVKHALRLFARRPVFTVAVILTLALGIGAGTAIFSLLRAVLLRPLPYHEPDRLVFAWLDRSGSPAPHARHGILTGTEVIEWHRRSTAFTSIAVIDSWQHSPTSRLDLIGADGAERLRAAFVTPNFFELLGVRAAVGRTFGSKDGGDGSSVVISDALWRRRFGADPSVVGQPIDLLRGRGGQQRHLIAGVLPPEFRFTYPRETEVWALLPWTQIRPSRGADYHVVARLEPRATGGAAQAELTTIAQDVARGHGLPESSVRNNVALVETLQEHLAAEVRAGLWLLVAGVGVVMLIACVNVALLFLALIVDRRREIALRAAIGAARWRIVRQFLAESGMLAAAGVALGVTLAWMLMPALRAIVPPLLPRGDEMSLDSAVLGFAVSAAMLTALVCGIAPAWHAQRGDIQTGLRQSSASATGDRSLALWRGAIVATQVAVVFVLLIAASLLLHSFWRMQHVDLGFDGKGVITMEMRLLNRKYRQPGGTATFQRLVLEHVRALPGVEQASMTSSVPMRGVDFVYIVGPVGSDQRVTVNMRTVDPEYFSLMRVPLLAGRNFSASDDEKGPKVAIVSQVYARALFGDVNPVGKQLDLQSGPTEIVGVVGDVRHQDVTKAAMPGLYFPRAQRTTDLICLVVRPAAGAQGVAAAVRSAAQSIDPEQPVEDVTTLDRIVREDTAEERFYMVSTAGFAGVAVLLAIAGLAGVVSRTVTERERELAIRLALGARSGQLVRLAVGHGMMPVGIGLAIGLIGAWAASRVLRRFLFEVSPLDPLTYGAALALLVTATMLACYLPARRATAVQPMTALRSE